MITLIVMILVLAAVYAGIVYWRLEVDDRVTWGKYDASEGRELRKQNRFKTIHKG